MNIVVICYLPHQSKNARLYKKDGPHKTVCGSEQELLSDIACGVLTAVRNGKPEEV